MHPADVKEAVRDKYGEAARRVTSGEASCCGRPGLRIRRCHRAAVT